MSKNAGNIVLEAKNVVYYYKANKGKKVLDDISYGFEIGKMYALPPFFGIFITCPCFISMISPLSFCFCSFTSFIQNHPPTDTWQKSH